MKYFYDLPENIIIDIYQYDNTYHDEYKGFITHTRKIYIIQ